MLCFCRTLAGHDYTLILELALPSKLVLRAHAIKHFQDVSRNDARIHTVAHFWPRIASCGHGYLVALWTSVACVALVIHIVLCGWQDVDATSELRARPSMMIASACDFARSYSCQVLAQAPAQAPA